MKIKYKGWFNMIPEFKSFFNPTLEFFNDGDAISDEIIDKVFSPYTKGENGQTGLGLSIVKRITEVFGYNITVQNMQDGVLFVIEKKRDNN